ncbi:serine/threonine protein kinase [Nostoc sp.]
MNSPSTPNSWIGRALGDNNRYRLDKLLGGGGMGDVFLAMDTRIGKQVALKILKDTLGASQEMRRRFEREIEICAALDSENIVQVTDCGVTTQGYPFYVMEYLRGQSLRQLLLREKRLSVERTINIVTQVCKGLQHAHTGVNIERQGATERIQVVHRDIKPDNIFLENIDSREVAKIVDFGIAKIRNESFEQTQFTSAFLGTFRYASPEQLKGVINLDQRSDIYSLGIIIYEMLSSADPFGFSINTRHHSEASWMYAHTNEPPKPLRSQLDCEDLPAQLEAAVMRCLEKEPDKRFASVEELNLALQAILVLIKSPKRILPEPVSPSPSPLKGSDEITIVRPINPDKKFPLEDTRDQIPQPPEDTILQDPPVVDNSHPTSGKSFNPQINPDKTTFQKPKNYSLRVVTSVTILLTACVAGFFAYPLVISIQTLNEIKTAQSKSNYKKCIHLSVKVNSDSGIYSQVQEILNECRQKYAIQLANENKCFDAYQVNDKIPKPLFDQIKTQIDNICVVPEKPEPPKF